MQDSIIVLLSTYNGEKYLQQQLDSLLKQTYQNFKIIARDDGSDDKSIEILKKYDIELLKSDKNVGASESFSILLKYALESYDDQYVMFCDQDDIWHEDKIEKTLHKMNQLESYYKDKPLLVHTDLRVVDESLQKIDSSYWHYQNIDVTKDDFQRLLVENVITGCTVMINRELAKLASLIPKDIIMHDWWLGLVASCFGKIGYIDNVTIDYRQHSVNDTGAKKFDLGFVLKQMLRRHDLSRYTIQADSFLQKYRDILDKDTSIMLQDFIEMKQNTFLQRINIFYKYGILKNGFIRNIGLLFRSS